MTAAYVALGANLGDRGETLHSAIDRLATLGTMIATSSFYETEPVGYLDQPRFLNAAAAIETGLDPETLLQELLRVEAELGRVRTFQNAPRSIDLDLLLYGSETINTEDLVLPHPRMLDRAFVLVPLAEIAPNAIHPVTDKSIKWHLDSLGSVEGITRVGEDGAETRS